MKSLLQSMTLWEGSWNASVISERVPFHFKIKIRTSSAPLRKELLEHIHDCARREGEAIREGKVLVQTLVCRCFWSLCYIQGQLDNSP